MNQRRGRGIHRIHPIMNPIEHPNIPPAADIYIEGEQIQMPDTPTKRKPTTSNYIEPSMRKCGHCTTPKSAGKWRRDRENPDRYLCNKCGMNQRRAQSRFMGLIRLEQQQQQHQILGDGYEDAESQRLTRSGRQGKPQPCALCTEKLPFFLTDCGHRICGECVPSLIQFKSCDDMLSCPCCNQAESASVYSLGRFLDKIIEC